VVHNDPAFLLPVVEALRAEGYEVLGFDGPFHTVNPVCPADWLEVTISIAKGTRAGIRIRTTNLPSGQFYEEPLGLFVGNPVTVSDVVNALTRFG
jgi:hypothetical protein